MLSTLSTLDAAMKIKRNKYIQLTTTVIRVRRSGDKSIGRRAFQFLFRSNSKFWTEK